MEEFQAWLPARARWLLQLLIELCGVAVFAALFVASVVNVVHNLNVVTPILEMPRWLFFAPLALGSV